MMAFRTNVAVLTDSSVKDERKLKAAQEIAEEVEVSVVDPCHVHNIIFSNIYFLN